MEGASDVLPTITTLYVPREDLDKACFPPTDDTVTKRVKLVASVQSRWNMGISYNHSFGMTDRYFILLEQPVTLSSMTLLGEDGKRPMPSAVFRNFDLHPQEKVRGHGGLLYVD